MSTTNALIRIPRFHPYDLVLAPAELSVAGSPYDVPFRTTFWGPEGQALTIPGYYDSEQGYVVRFAPTMEGAWHYESASPVAALDGAQGELCCIANPYPAVHGQLQIDPQHRHHFCYEDGTRYFLRGYEVNWLMMVDQHDPTLARVSAFLDSIQRVGFNLVTVNVYAYSHRPPEEESDPRSVKPALAPWVGGNDHPDYARFDEAFFRHYDRVMEELRRRGIVAHIMLHVYNKKVNWPPFGSPDDDRYWRYVVARYQAFCNVVWDPAKESYYRDAAYIWGRVGLLRQLDGYRRLVTVHDPNVGLRTNDAWTQRWHDPRKELCDALADFKSDQIHQDWYNDAVQNYTAAQRPYVNIEYGYEQGIRNLTLCWTYQDWREALRRHWLVTMGGAYPNYYWCNTAWDVFVPTPEPPGYPCYRHYADFWESTRYWLLAPDNSPLAGTEREGVFCRASRGQEYVVLSLTGAGFCLTLEGCAAPLQGVWVNPINGVRVEIGTLANGAHRLIPPFGEGNWAVLHVRP